MSRLGRTFPARPIARRAWRVPYVFGLQAGAVTRTSATLSWSEVPGATYDLMHDGAVTPSATTSTSLALIGLAEGRQHLVRVRARFGTSVGEWSEHLAFFTAPSDTLLLYEPWTGPDLAPWGAGWDVQVGTLDISNNRGRMLPMGGLWAPSRAAAQNLSVGDVDITFRYEPFSSIPYFPYLSIRTSGAPADDWAWYSPNGYQFSINPFYNLVEIRRSIDATNVLLASNSPAQPLGNDVMGRVRAVGPSLQVKVWNRWTVEPEPWTVETTDHAHASGGLMLTHARGGSPGVTYGHFDDLAVFEMVPATVELGWGAIPI